MPPNPDFDDDDVRGSPEAAAEAVLAKEGLNPTWEKAKIVLKTVAFCAAIGLVVGAVALPIAGGMLGMNLLSTGAGIANTAGHMAAASPWTAIPAAIAVGVPTIIAWVKTGAWNPIPQAANATAVALAGALGTAIAVGGLGGLAIGVAAGLIIGLSKMNEGIATMAEEIGFRHQKHAQRVKQHEQMLAQLNEMKQFEAQQRQELKLDANPNAQLPGIERAAAGLGKA